MKNIKKVIIMVGIVSLVTILSSCAGKEKQVIDNVDNVQVSDSTKKALTDYSDSALANAEGDIVIFFHASWCGTCRASKEDIITKGVPEDMTILIADYDKETELKKKYGVTVQTTFVQVDNQGNMIKKWQGGKLAEIVKNVEKMEK